MTFIQSKKQHALVLNLVIIVLIACVMTSAIWLILLYNQTVSLEHGASLLGRKTAFAEAENADLKERLLALFDPGRMSEFAVIRGLIAERNPTYIESSWEFVSHR